MGVNVVDIDRTALGCSSAPSVVVVRLRARRDSPLLDETQVVPWVDDAKLIDAATSLSAFEDEAEETIPAFWEALGNDADAEELLYEIYRQQRLAC